jgi:two-component system CheB/CheR fusion protein
VSVIRRNVELEARLIDDMLDLTRIVRGKLALHRRVIDGCEPLRHAVETCQADAAEKAIALTCDWPDAPVYIDADAARLQQIYWNVIKNGVKFTPERGRITVVAAATERGGLRVQVSDSGKGIDPAALQRIFDAFEQVGDGVTHRYGGLGLGLAICKGLVELHGGSIRAASDGPGRGATFVVEFPPPVEKKGAPGEWTTASVGSPGGARMAGCRVLLVEDHEGTAQVTARLLRCYGHSVVTAGCVRDAVQAFEANPVDVVISDLGLPDGTGHELLGELLRIAKRPISAIAVSGYGMEHDLLQSAQAGFLEHLVKPINATQLQAAIARIHGGRPAASQAQRRGRSV